MARAHVGGIDDTIWADPDWTPRVQRLGGWRFIPSLIAIAGLPLLVALVPGFDWVSLVTGIAIGAVLLVVLHRRVMGPVLFSLLVLVTSLAALEAVNAFRFGTLSLAGPPLRVHWCGQEWLPGTASQPVPPTLAPSPGSGSERVVLVTPSGAKIFAPVGCTSGQVPASLFSPTGPSGGVTYLGQGFRR